MSLFDQLDGVSDQIKNAHKPQLFDRGGPEYECEKVTVILSDVEEIERDCGKCKERGSSSTLVINSKDYGDPTCPQRVQDEDSILHKAVKLGDRETVEHYTSISPEAINKTNRHGQTPLHFSCWFGWTGLVILLSRVYKSNIHATDNQGWGLLHFICDCKFPNLDIVKYLVEALKLNPRQKTKKGTTPVVLARFRKHWSIVDYLTIVMQRLKPTEPRDQLPLLVLRDDVDDCQSLQQDDHPNGDRNMSRLDNRLFTFTMGPNMWPRARPTGRQLAEQGFIYSGVEQRVLCFCCKAVLDQWNDKVDPLIKHYKKNPSCQFILDNFRPQLDRLLSQQSVQHFNQSYSSSSARLHSFRTWPYSSIISYFKLASAGFYYTGVGSKVRCFSCGFLYERWLNGDIPLEIHKVFRPACEFLRSLEPVSSPLATDFQPQARPIAQPTFRQPDYENVDNRIKSFKLLPKEVPVSGKECAEAGLFFLRKPDVMQCFKCDVIVQGWVSGDVAVEKHRAASEQCKFLKEFFSCKLDKDDRDSYATIDPSSLPEPEYTKEDLERMASHNVLPEMSDLSLHQSDYTTIPPSREFGMFSRQDSQTSGYVSATPFLSTSRQPHYMPSPEDHPNPVRSNANSSMSTNKRPLMPSPQYSQSSGYASADPSLSYNRHLSDYSFNSRQSLERYFQHGSTSLTSGPHHSASQHSPAATLTTLYTSPKQQPVTQQYRKPSSLPDPSHPDDSRQCVVCMDGGLEVVLLPCRHMCVCETCSKQIDQCPMCRRPIESTVKVYLP